MPKSRLPPSEESSKTSEVEWFRKRRLGPRVSKTGTLATTRTNEVGVYAFMGLAPGHYGGPGPEPRVFYVTILNAMLTLPM